MKRTHHEPVRHGELEAMLHQRKLHGIHDDLVVRLRTAAGTALAHRPRGHAHPPRVLPAIETRLVEAAEEGEALEDHTECVSQERQARRHAERRLQDEAVARLRQVVQEALPL
eukprot:5851197-Alexandrium_andersonii.AAC.1